MESRESTEYHPERRILQHDVVNFPDLCYLVSQLMAFTIYRTEKLRGVLATAYRRDSRGFEGLPPQQRRKGYSADSQYAQRRRQRGDLEGGGAVDSTYRSFQVAQSILVLSNVTYVKEVASGTGLEIADEFLKIPVLVEEIPEHGLELELTREKVYEEVLARLQARGLMPLSSAAADAPRNRYVYVNINVGESIFNIRVSFERLVYFPPDGRPQFSKTPNLLVTYGSTWVKEILGAHDENPRFIMDILGRLVDAFITEYLEVNGKRSKKADIGLLPYNPEESI